MTPQEEIVQLREEIKKLNQLAVQRARRFAIMLGVVAIAMLISFVYAFIQQIAAEKNAEEALRQFTRAEQSSKLAEQAEQRAQMAEALAQSRLIQLEKSRGSMK